MWEELDSKVVVEEGGQGERDVSLVNDVPVGRSGIESIARARGRRRPGGVVRGVWLGGLGGRVVVARGVGGGGGGGGEGSGSAGRDGGVGWAGGGGGGGGGGAVGGLLMDTIADPWCLGGGGKS